MSTTINEHYSDAENALQALKRKAEELERENTRLRMEIACIKREIQHPQSNEMEDYFAAMSDGRHRLLSDR